MFDLVSFFTENLNVILILTGVIFLVLVVFAIYGNDFSDIPSDKSSNKKAGKVVTIETFNNTVSN